MRPSKWISKSEILLSSQARLVGEGTSQSGKAPLGMKIRRAMLLVLLSAAMTGQAVQAGSQALSSSEGSLDSAGSANTTEELDMTYVRPTQATKLKTYAFDAFGPYALVSGALFAGIDQATNTPPEWRQGFSGYSERFASDVGITAARTTTRFLLADVMKQDTLYYRCECRGMLPRLRHAVISTVTARSERDGHRLFSIPALVAPYGGSMTAVYGWYPDRYNAKDAFRMGNYTLLESIGGNIALEFLYSGPHSLLSRMHLNNSHGSPIQGPNR